jgi:hypothetical protein
MPHHLNHDNTSTGLLPYYIEMKAADRVNVIGPILEIGWENG